VVVPAAVARVAGARAEARAVAARVAEARAGAARAAGTAAARAGAARAAGMEVARARPYRDVRLRWIPGSEWMQRSACTHPAKSYTIHTGGFTTTPCLDEYAIWASIVLWTSVRSVW
jgi:hypothetical protein